MNDFATALAESFAVTPTRTTGLVIDTFDNWSGSTAAHPVLGSVSPCLNTEHEPVLSCGGTCRSAAHEPVLNCGVCRSAMHEPVLNTGWCRSAMHEPVIGTTSTVA